MANKKDQKKETPQEQPGDGQKGKSEHPITDIITGLISPSPKRGPTPVEPPKDGAPIVDDVIREEAEVGVTAKVLATLRLSLPLTLPVTFLLEASKLYPSAPKWKLHDLDFKDGADAARTVAAASTKGEVAVTGISPIPVPPNMALPELVPGFPLSKGVYGVVGGMGTGKTTFLENVVQELARREISPRIISFLEPVEPLRYLGRQPGIRVAPSSKAMLIELGYALISPPEETGDVILVDSLSSLAFQSWTGWGTAVSGLSTGFMFWLTALSNAAYALNKTVFVSFNPGPDTTSRGTDLTEVLASFVGGRVHGVVSFSKGGSGTFVTRTLDSGRVAGPIPASLLSTNFGVKKSQGGADQSTSVSGGPSGFWGA